MAITRDIAQKELIGSQDTSDLQSPSDFINDREPANIRQIGGDHYRKRKYQHWDLVIDTGMGYLEGNATKYVTRWRDKNGLQDLDKSLHYLDKTIEANAVNGYENRCLDLTTTIHFVERFVLENEIPYIEAQIVYPIVLWKSPRDLLLAKTNLTALIEMVKVIPARF